MDDMMITSPDFKHCLSNPILMLNCLANCGYKVSLQKTQICKQKVFYLGFQLSQRIHSLMMDQKQAIVNIKTPTNWRQFCRFSRMASFCNIWIANYALITRPLYKPLKETDSDPMIWISGCQQVFNALKEKLMTILALGLLNLNKPFMSHVHKRQSVELGMLLQILGNTPQLIAYFSKPLDATIKGWPPYLEQGQLPVTYSKKLKSLLWDSPYLYLYYTKF